MDKFNPRPGAKTRKRKRQIFVGAFVALATAFGALFMFGNAAAAWLGALYGAALLAGAIHGLIAAFRGYGLWSRQWPVQPAQGPGFTPLELAALTELFANDRAYPGIALRFTEVTSRLNTGTGCITTIQTNRSHVIPRPSVTPYFSIDRLSSSVGVKYWRGQGDTDQLEIFSGGESTVDLDWEKVSFDRVESGPRPPETPPIIDSLWRPRLERPA